ACGPKSGGSLLRGGDASLGHRKTFKYTARNSLLSSNCLMMSSSQLSRSVNAVSSRNGISFTCMLPLRSFGKTTTVFPASSTYDPGYHCEIDVNRLCTP